MKHQLVLTAAAIVRARCAAVALASLWILSSSPCFAACEDRQQTGTDSESLRRAMEILESNGVDVGNEYRVTRLVAYDSGGGMVWVKRLYRGLPVFRDELAFHFRGWAEPVQRLIRSLDPARVARLEIFDIDPLPSRVRGRVALLGDAAHSTAPDLGQGGCVEVEQMGRPVALDSPTPTQIRHLARSLSPQHWPERY